MKEIIRKTVLKLFPELTANMHLPQFAVITSIPDAPDTEEISDSFRPKLAANIKLLDEHLNVDEDQPAIKAVPIAIPAAGNEKGIISFPSPGTIVEIAFAYGKQSLPFIRSIMPYRLSLPVCDSNSIRIQGSCNSFQECNRSGTWTRQTNGSITDDSRKYILNTIEKLENISREIKKISGSSKESISGEKKLIAGAIKLLTAGASHLGAATNNNITAGNDINIVAAKNIYKTIGGIETDTVLGQRHHNTTGNITKATAGSDTNISAVFQHIQAPKIHLGSEIENVLKILSEFMTSTIAALNTLSTHTHPSTGGINEGNAVANKATEISTQKSRLDPIVK